MICPRAPYRPGARGRTPSMVMRTPSYVSVKDSSEGDALRLDAARAALPYERPRLNSILLSAAEGSSAMVAVSADAEINRLIARNV